MTSSSIDNPRALGCAFANATACASNDELRPILNCVAIYADADGVRFVSTDSYILCVQELALTSQPRLGIETWDGTWTAMLHSDELDVARHVLAGLKETPIDLERVDEGLMMKVAQREILLPQFSYDGDFPDWRQLLATETTDIGKLHLSSWVVRRLGGLKLPNVDKDEAVVDLAFSGAATPVRFDVGKNRDHELKVYGALMPVVGAP